MVVHILNVALPSTSETSYIEVAPLVFAGIGYCFFGAILYAIIADVVKEKVMGTAYGIVLAFVNIGLAIFPVIGSAIHDATLDTVYGFFWVSLLYS